MSVRYPNAIKIRFAAMLGNAIRRQRHEAALSLAEVAKALDCSIATVAKWEDGTLSVPAYSLHQLERLFGCNLYDLMPEMDEAAE